MDQLAALFRLVRWPNLLMIALVQYLIRFTLTEPLGIPHVLSRLDYSLGVLCSLCLAAGGYVVNDLHDLRADQKNKPQRVVIGRYLSADRAWLFYGLLNLVAVFSGFWVAQKAGMSNLWLIPVLAAGLLYLYAIDLKKRALLGNLVVSLLVALPILLAGVFDILPAAGEGDPAAIRAALEVILGYGLFAFLANLIRELIKDTEDLEGDEEAGYRTLAVRLGRAQMRLVIIPLIIVLLVFAGAYNLYLFDSDKLSAYYLLLCVNLPLTYLVWIVALARQKKHYHLASILTKMIMLAGILSMLIFTLSIQYQMDQL